MTLGDKTYTIHTGAFVKTGEATDSKVSKPTDEVASTHEVAPTDEVAQLRKELEIAKAEDRLHQLANGQDLEEQLRILKLRIEIQEAQDYLHSLG